jgi:hypothetical protein
MDPEHWFFHIFTVLLVGCFLDEKDWEVRHGGLLGLKYLLAVRGEGLQPALLAHIYPRLHSGSVPDPSPLLQFSVLEPFPQGCGSGIWCLFYPWIRDLGCVKKLDPGSAIGKKTGSG